MSNKGRFDGLDVQAMVAFLQNSFLGRRVVNIYDCNGETYVFKIEGETNQKQFLLLESGIRFHAIRNYTAPASSLPSPFAAKLRKHLRSLRLEHIQQIGTDRVVVFQFGVGDCKHSLILELYARGNIILADKDYKVLALLRSHLYQEREEELSNIAVQVGQVYPASYATSLGSDASQQGKALSTYSDFVGWARQKIDDVLEKNKTRKKKKQQSINLKLMLSQNSDSGVFHYGPSLVEHCILQAGLQPHNSLSDLGAEEALMTKAEWTQLRQSLLEEGQRILNALKESGPGYIFYRNQTTGDENDKGAKTTKVYEEFVPVVLKQHKGRLQLEYDNFSAATEEYFDSIQSQRSMQKALTAEKAAAAKLERVRADQRERMENLEKQQELLEQQAATVQMHAENVDNALAVINSALDTGMDWDQLEQVVKVEQQNNNPVALLIHKLELDQDSMVLRLPVGTTDLANLAENDEMIDVRIFLKDSAYSNANNLFAKYRSSKEKSAKTAEASTKALKAAEETAKRQLAEAQKRSKYNPMSTGVKKKPAWFEKFHWFVTSENYLVLGGRDAHQNELLVKRYLRPGDAYLHAEVHGAASCILRAKRRRTKTGGTKLVPLSVQALREAGHFTICRSSAWSSRMVTSAWWVESHQVSKTAPTGEYLTVGSFMIRGKKNFLPPSQLEMGLAVLFLLGDEESIQRHKNERRDFAFLEEENQDEEDSTETGTLPVLEKQQVLDAGDNVLEEPAIDGGTSDDSTGLSPPIAAKNDGNSSEPSNNNVANGHANSEVSKPATKQKKQGLSAKDRRMIKKYGSLEAAQLAEQEHAMIELNSQQQSVSCAPKSVPAESGGSLKRGKKSKQKRAQNKYADQDDEDRELALLALHGGGKSKQKKKSAGNKVNNVISKTQEKVAAETTALLVKDVATVRDQLPDTVQEFLSQCVTVSKNNSAEEAEVRWDKFDAGVLEQLLDLSPVEAQEAVARRLLNLKTTTRVDNFSSSLGGIIRTAKKHGYESLNTDKDADEGGPKRKTKEDAIKQNKNWKQTLENEGILDGFEDEDAVDDTGELNKLTGKPQENDLIVAAVPVCAPYQTLSQYMYRVKLTPGSMKRGKASKQCLEVLLKGGARKSENMKRQLDLIKQVAENDWVQSICGDVKISAPGASKAAQKSKAKGKKTKKKG